MELDVDALLLLLQLPLARWSLAAKLRMANLMGKGELLN